MAVAWREQVPQLSGEYRRASELVAQRGFFEYEGEGVPALGEDALAIHTLGQGGGDVVDRDVPASPDRMSTAVV